MSGESAGVGIWGEGSMLSQTSLQNLLLTEVRRAGSRGPPGAEMLET